MQSATSFQLLGLKEDVETEPVSSVCWVRRRRKAGDKRRGDSLLTSAFFQLKHLTSDGKLN